MKGKSFLSLFTSRPLVFLRLATVISLAVLGFGLHVLSIESNRGLLKPFYDFRGALEPPPSVACAVISDADYERPLALSVKYPVPPKILLLVLQRILDSDPLVVFLDEQIVSNDAELTSLISRSNGRIKLHRVFVVDKSKDVNGKSLESRLLDQSGIEIPTATIFTEMDTVYNFPRATDILKQLSTSKKVSSPQIGRSLLRFYGSAGTVEKRNFSEVLNEPNHKITHFARRVIFVGQESGIFLKGQPAAIRHAVPITGDKMSHPEILATMAANAQDGTSVVLSTHAEETIAFFLILFASLTAQGFRYRLTFTTLVALIFLSTLGGYFLFANFYLWLENITFLVLTPTIALLCSSFAIILEITAKDSKTRAEFFMK